jgi:peptidoglycan/xylan/chitin deacetylase (PgdA/CDA1 family)
VSSDADIRPTRYLLFHKSIGRFSYGSTNFSPQRLERLLGWLSQSAYNFVSLERPAHKDVSSLGITFDDGYEHLVDILPPLIDTYGIKPIIFVPTAFIGKPADWDYSYRFCKVSHLERRSIRSLSDLGVEFGSHGHTHTALTSLSSRKLEIELRQSRDILSDITGKPVRSIGYPFGRFNQEILDLAAEFGLIYGFTSKYPSSSDTPSTLGRISIYGYDTHLSVGMKLGSSPFHSLERLKTQITNQMSGGTVLLNRIRRSY